MIETAPPAIRAPSARSASVAVANIRDHASLARKDSTRISKADGILDACHAPAVLTVTRGSDVAVTVLEAARNLRRLGRHVLETETSQVLPVNASAVLDSPVPNAPPKSARWVVTTRASVTRVSATVFRASRVPLATFLLARTTAVKTVGALTVGASATRHILDSSATKRLLAEFVSTEFASKISASVKADGLVLNVLSNYVPSTASRLWATDSAATEPVSASRHGLVITVRRPSAQACVPITASAMTTRRSASATPVGRVQNVPSRLALNRVTMASAWGRSVSVILDGADPDAIDPIADPTTRAAVTANVENMSVTVRRASLDPDAVPRYVPTAAAAMASATKSTTCASVATVGWVSIVPFPHAPSRSWTKANVLETECVRILESASASLDGAVLDATESRAPTSATVVESVPITVPATVTKDILEANARQRSAPTNVLDMEPASLPENASAVAHLPVTIVPEFPAATELQRMLVAVTATVDWATAIAPPAGPVLSAMFANAIALAMEPVTSSL